jgi:hypothetical protein
MLWRRSLTRCSIPPMSTPALFCGRSAQEVPLFWFNVLSLHWPALFHGTHRLMPHGPSMIPSCKPHVLRSIPCSPVYNLCLFIPLFSDHPVLHAALLALPCSLCACATAPPDVRRLCALRHSPEESFTRAAGELPDCHELAKLHTILSSVRFDYSGTSSL